MSTALARTDAQSAQSKSAAVRQQLPPDIQAKIEENRARNAVVAAIRGTQWGAATSPDLVRAVAQYAYERGVDPVSEIEILGGRIYLTVMYYRRRGAPLLRDGTVRDIRHDQIGRDPRLDELVAECEALAKQADDAGRGDEAAHWRAEAFATRREIVRRKQLRAQYNAPEQAAAVCVTTLALAHGVDIVGANWCGGGARKGDPVGDAEPAKTAESRSERRAWIKLITGDAAKDHPAVAALRTEQRAITEDGAVVAEAVAVEQAEVAAQVAAAKPHALVTAGADDPYGMNADAIDRAKAEAEDLALEIAERAPIHEAQRVEMPEPGPVSGALFADEQAGARRTRKTSMDPGQGA